ncbi:S-type Pyocin [Pseudomonas syringae]|uniref:colicin E3/pyocin S6 family cytotoxin n=1 Tax=Pseudomonas syringae TaxID=317 RepID=UPI000897D99B|nr:colicin E3/pyocin S6 family cytotoxin [Pseudomonas syringae]SDW41807.1 S-type Pyocin [Pseudomonas syringae]SFL69471.1 S-type Pyocin [Pseudomonas syringae]
MNKKKLQTWRHSGGDGGGYRYLDYLTDAELAACEAENKRSLEKIAKEQAFQDELFRKHEQKVIQLHQREIEQKERCGFVFSKSSRLPCGVADDLTPSPTEMLDNYGTWAVLATGSAIGTNPAPLKLVSSASGSVDIARRLGGRLSLDLVTKAAGSSIIGGTMLGTIALLMPNNTAEDSAFYKREQYNLLEMARTQVRINIKQIEKGHLTAYGFNTGARPEWQKVPIIKAIPRNHEFIAELGQGINLIWTPIAGTHEIFGIPALEVKSFSNLILVYPTSDRAKKTIESPLYPPSYQDAILVFPQDTGLQPIYVALSLSASNYHPAPALLPGFPDAMRAKRKTAVQNGGGLRKRWKTEKGLILEWDSQHGAVEMYDKRGKHLGEFDPETGTQTKDADPKRSIEP